MCSHGKTTYVENAKTYLALTLYYINMRFNDSNKDIRMHYMQGTHKNRESNLGPSACGADVLTITLRSNCAYNLTSN